ncbi:hypothetical protein CU633_21935 [Bacillus sp. V3-13]|uniref:hypothetical protein n=1 Tax=Bacillus sp. V3-13 TaxID=2053728 RepID=UPI000C78FF8A|nr:hypothetical protein [Bacillus sp. V3-13]PLR75286.1 hypothetical protein CU633_21935 [Bacillus sp. V3-13]
MARRRCYLVVAKAPEDVKLREANALFNDYIADQKRGQIVFHDHFVGEPGGVAFFDVQSEQQKAALQDDLPEWDIEIHPLILSRTAAGLVYQLDYTSTEYANVPLSDLIERVKKAEHEGTDPSDA